MKIAAIQMASGADKVKNLTRAETLVSQAAKNQATFIMLPEVFHHRGPDSEIYKHAEAVPGPAITRLLRLARRLRVWILAGSIHEKTSGTQKVYNTSCLLSPQGKIAAKYRKRHLFEARLKHARIGEAGYCLEGACNVSATVEGFRVGLSICYDLRFPEMYRQYARQGASLLCVPSAFTYETGRDHWEVLLRARAIENRCYVVAANQHGRARQGIRSYGNSMIVDPWGQVLTRADTNGDCVLYADMDKITLTRARRALPY